MAQCLVLGSTTVVLAIVAFLLTLAAILPLPAGLGLVAILIWFAVPGIVLARRLYGSDAGGRAAALLIGPAWGYVLSSLALLAIWAGGSRNIWVLMLAPVPAALATWPARRLAGAVAVPRFSRRDIGAAALALLAVPAIVGLPYAHVGIDLPEGRAYRAYFTADFVWEMAVVAELSKGDMPPRNPYYLNDDLHYYWLMHLLPSVEHHALEGTPTVDELLLVNALWSGLAFTAFLYFFVRHFVGSPWAAALGCVFVLLCSSFEGVERIWWLRNEGIPLQVLRSLNIDAITNWTYGGMKVDGLHRLLLYQPQHQTAYLLGMSALLVLHQAHDVSRVTLYFVIGAFIAGTMLFSSFAALMLAGMAAAYAAWRVIRARQRRAMIPGAVAAAVPMVAALVLIDRLGYVDTGGELVKLGLNPLATHRVMWNTFLSFGPVLFGAAIGIAFAVWSRTLARFTVLWVILALCATFYFLVDLPDSTNSVGWHAGKVAFMAMTPLVGFGLQQAWARGGWARRLIVPAMAVVAAAAVPTVIIDVYNTQDVWNRTMGPGFRWTVVLSPEEVEGLNWIKRGTFKSARVQVDPVVRDRDTWAYIPAFAERRMSAGFPISMIPIAKYNQAKERIREIYRSTSAEQAYDLAVRHCVDYLVIGPPERTAYPQLEPALDGGNPRFIRAFRNDALTVYYVPRDRERSSCSG